MRTFRGFTLIELMIVIAVIGVIAAFAYPSYQGYMENARRADAQGALMSAANAMERFYTENYTYVGAAAGTEFPAQAPFDGTTKYYQLSITAQTVSTYTLQAAPIGAQAGDRCANLTLTSTGARGTSSAETDCWQ